MRHYSRLLCGAAAIAILTSAGAAHAEGKAQVQFDIPAQPLTAALNQFGIQSGSAILFKADVTGAKVSKPLTGPADPEMALAMMLDGTGLSYRREGQAFVIVSASDPQSGSAAGDGADGTVQALIVTAQKREENIQDVPIAMSAFTQEDLDRSQVAGGRDLMTQVPNMTFTKTNFTGYSIQLRGIGTQAISATTDAAVAVAFNNTPFIRNRFFEQEFYDLQRVEVLRGPQGTLYGRNATAGVVNLISQKPKFTYEAKLSGDVSNYSSTRFEGMLNVPLVEDKVALRLAGAWTKRDGFVENQISGNPIDGRDLWSTRLSLRFAPTDKLDANLIWEHFEENDDRLRSGKQLCHQDDRIPFGGVSYSNYLSQGCLAASLYGDESFEVPDGYSLPYYLPLVELGVPVIRNFNPYVSLTQSRDLRVIESTVDPKYTAKSDLVELQVSYDLGAKLTLASETSYNYDTIFSMEDYNRFNTASGAFLQDGYPNARPSFMRLNGAGYYEFCDPQIGCADRVVAVDASRAKSSQFSQEFRLNSDYDGPFNFSAGANYLRYDTEDKYYVFINTLTMLALAGTGAFYAQTLPPYEVGVTDNQVCLWRGALPPDNNTFASLSGCIAIDPNPIENVNDLGHNYFLSKNPYKLISYAAFGEAYWNVTDDLKITAGVRITRDEKQAPRIPSWLIAKETVGLSVKEVENQTWTEPTGRLAVDWKPDLAFTDETLLYASYSHGYKAGGSNPPPAGVVVWPNLSPDGLLKKVADSTTKPRTFDPEFVDAFEVGAKNTLLDGRLTANLAAFYYDYTGYQVSQIVDRSAVNYNFDAKIWGLELESDWQVAENFRLGLKAGYEHTEIADGERAIDIMDRTAGRTDWLVLRPFPSFTSNCVLPTYVVDAVDPSTAFNGGNMGPCENAYTLLGDPVTGTHYADTDAPTTPPDPNRPGYQGFNPLHDYGANNGEGFFKDLGGHELPNAPHVTATLTADYTLPLPADWLMTLHTDLYYQSEAWTRVFNTPGYDKLKAYTNINLAAIFTNEDAGWKVMAYVKNVMDRDSITGAFLNSDDTGLTTNVFLTEPRLYGLRVTKDFNGGPWWTGAGGTGPYPLWIELGGTVLREDAPYEAIKPSAFDAFSASLSPIVAQNRDLDWGDQREIRVSYKPAGGTLSVKAGFRYGKVNSGTSRFHSTEVAGPVKCGLPRDLIPLFIDLCKNAPPLGSINSLYAQGSNWADSVAREEEEHSLIEFEVGRDFGFGALADSRSTVSAGLRYGQFKSHSDVLLDGIPNLYLPEGFFGFRNTTFNQYRTTADAQREFEGMGPVLSWDAAQHLFGNEGVGHVDLDWSISGGVMFGRQKTALSELDGEASFDGLYDNIRLSTLSPMVNEPLSVSARNTSRTVPFFDLSAGLSYEIQRVKVSAGYRWERYFDVLDVGYQERRDADRTLDGPYFKIAAGFGG